MRTIATRFSVRKVAVLAFFSMVLSPTKVFSGGSIPPDLPLSSLQRALLLLHKPSSLTLPPVFRIEIPERPRIAPDPPPKRPWRHTATDAKKGTLANLGNPGVPISHFVTDDLRR